MGTLVIFGLVSALAWSPTPLKGQEGSPDIRHDPTLKALRIQVDGAGSAFEESPAPFPLRVRGDPVPHSVFFSVVLPGEVLAIEVEPKEDRPTLVYSAGAVASSSDGGWSWEAPDEPGAYALRLVREGPAQAIHLNVFVLRPASEMVEDVLNGYRMGSYRSIPLRGDSIYIPPPGFIEVPSDDQTILVSPHFTVGQFLCKQEGNPKYLSLSRYLVIKLEAILEAVNGAGFAAPTLHVMSGFRTPWYNELIGNQTDYSRHLWGGAADIFVDADRNGIMDDLNGDGRSTIEDARILQDIAERVDTAELPGSRAGGLSAYRRNSAHGPFVHVDARGRAARW